MSIRDKSMKEKNGKNRNGHHYEISVDIVFENNALLSEMQSSRAYLNDLAGKATGQAMDEAA